MSYSIGFFYGYYVVAFRATAFVCVCVCAFCIRVSFVLTDQQWMNARWAKGKRRTENELNVCNGRSIATSRGSRPAQRLFGFSRVQIMPFDVRLDNYLCGNCVTIIFIYSGIKEQIFVSIGVDQRHAMWLFFYFRTKKKKEQHKHRHVSSQGIHALK